VDVPEGIYDDSVVVLNIVKDEGPLAILNEIYVFGEFKGTQGGVMEASIKETVPKKFKISKIMPVPLCEEAVIEIGVPKKSYINLTLYDVTGRFVKNVFSGEKEPGYHTIRFDAKDDRGRRLSQGVYFLRMEASDFKENQKLVLIR